MCKKQPGPFYEDALGDQSINEKIILQLSERFIIVTERTVCYKNHVDVFTLRRDYYENLCKRHDSGESHRLVVVIYASDGCRKYFSAAV